MKKSIRPALVVLCVVVGIGLLLAVVRYDGIPCKKAASPDAYDNTTTQRQPETDSTAPTQTQPVQPLDIAVIENRENEFVFDVSITDYIDGFNRLYFQDTGNYFLRERSQWQCFSYDSAIHSPYATDCYYFMEEDVDTEPTISVYVPATGDYIQEITINFDEHSYTDSAFAKYQQLCFYTMKVFFPTLDDRDIQDLCTQIIALGQQHVYDSDAWYSSTSVPYACFYRDGIGVYPYFAIGDYEYFCIIPVTESTLQEWTEKGVWVNEIG